MGLADKNSTCPRDPGRSQAEPEWDAWCWCKFSDIQGSEASSMVPYPLFTELGAGSTVDSAAAQRRPHRRMQAVK